MLKTVIFDMDGVIVDTEPVHYYAFMQHFKELGIQISDSEYSTYTGNSTKNVYERIKSEFSLSEDIETLVQQKRSIFNDAFDSKEDLYLLDGVEDLIKHFHKSGIQLILASSSAKVTINRIFRRFDLFNYFSHIVSGEDFPKSKPHPAIFEHAHCLSGNTKNECIVIEDSENGVQAAKSAGIYCIGYNSFHSKLQDLSKADYVINSFSEINSNKINSLLEEKKCVLDVKKIIN
ncbi:MAG: HAD family hydrolase [Flavobacteriales bacterium]|nr:HAD family hydrolase [Flavobacteriales bacterium]